MEEMGVIKAKEIIKSEAGETTPLDGNGFYAVANGAKPGIYPFYRGENGAEREVIKVEGSCHKRFRTMAQAEAFMEDWKGTYAEVWSELIKEALDKGFRPRDIRSFGSCEMGLFTELFLYKPVRSTDVNEITEKAKKQLSLQDNKRKG
ncbi:SinR repressor/SinI anti-repressor, dimerization [Penicillium griseofulvum]|uniref:SinR repressor/SinI anti-repressor, dimerization n=1 Tax=Penicillium patulum TaxID=5078 RepID=A0A135LKR2_PENPA|nr:SinR repressor/SinI anti-repressor, dimerization [Penicillium griseofulvum]KXG49563.1 SinR repressor/SinI anti-repressor, dimerization [Penicillium griseofulvum]